MSKYDGQVEVVVGVMIVHEDKVLLIQSPKWGDHWLFPGGHVEYGETLFAAAEREGEEEIGLKLQAKSVTSMGEDIFLPEFHRPAHLMYFHILCQATTQEVRVDPKEISAVQWLTPAEALKLTLSPNVALSIQRLQSGERFPITSRQGSSKRK